jgi:hypothetical protein
MMTKQSASRIKLLQSCHWHYYARYILNIPDTPNDGASRGTVCHEIFEYLSKLKTNTQYKRIVSKQDPFASVRVKKKILATAKDLNVDDEENLSLIKKMILNGLSCNFYGLDLGVPNEAHAELSFNIVTDEYNIRGFIDQLFLYKELGIALIRDYKTSKSTFSGKELEDNLQHYFYSLAVRHLFPEYKQRMSEFLFLKFDLEKEGLVKMDVLDEDDLDGFEVQLAETQQIIDGFNKDIACSNFAYDAGFPTDSSFSGRLLCGFAKKPNQLKKDGTPMWHCPAKFAFNYFIIKDSDGNFVRSEKEDEFNKNSLKDGESYELVEYSGCPKHS